MRQTILGTTIIIINVLAVSPLQASQVTNLNVEKSGEWIEGSNYAVATSGNLVYLGNGSQFQVIDVTDPDSPATLASVTLPGIPKKAYGIDVLDGLAYVSAWDKVCVFDVTDPVDPVLILEQDVPHSMRVEASDDHICVSGLEGVRIMEWASDGTLTQLSKYPDTQDIYVSSPDATVRGDYLYYSYGGMTVFDISDPAVPLIVGEHNEYPRGYTRIALQGNQAFVITGDLLRVFDVSDPAHPTKIDSLKTPGYTGRFTDIAMIGRFAYCATNEGLLVIGVPGGDRPTVVWESGIGATGLAISNNRVFVSHDSWLRSLDITDPASPVEGWIFPTGSEFRDLDLAGETAYIADKDYGLRILDVSNPVNPEPVGDYYAGDTVTQLEVVKDHVYLFGYLSLSVIDVSDPENPVETARRSSTHYYASAAVGQGHLFVSKQSVGFEVLDVSVPSTPVEEGDYGIDLGLDPCLAIDGDLLFVVEGRFIPKEKRHLRIIDVSDPSNPNEVGSFLLFDLVAFASGMGYYPRDIAVRNGYVFLPCAEIGLRIIDATDPSAPHEVYRYETDCLMNDASISENLLYISECPKRLWLSGPQTITVLNVSDPANPVEVGRYSEMETRRNVDLVASQQTLYVVSQTANKDYVIDFTVDMSVFEFQRGRQKDEPKIRLLSNGSSPTGKPVLGRSFPNPFNPTTTIEYTLPVAGRVGLEIYDVQGRSVTTLVDGFKNPGGYTATWNGVGADGATVPSGVYFVRLEFEKGIQTRKIVLVK